LPAAPIPLRWCSPGPAATVTPGAAAAAGCPRGNYRRAYKAGVTDANQHNDPADRLEHLELRGPYDLRRTYATWLEDGGIPSRVIDELMGHEGGRIERGISPMGALYRETTAEMLARVTAAIDDRLAIALKVAARLSAGVGERRRLRRTRKATS
jgi:hypothetical protein